MYRTFEANFTLDLVFYKQYITKFMDGNQKTEKELKKAVVNAFSDVLIMSKKGKTLSIAITNIY